jgi:hypothetical protein
MRPHFIETALLLISTCGQSALQAQTVSQQIYSLVSSTPNSTVKIIRNGSKEVVESTTAQGVQLEIYDFQAHQLYTKSLEDPGALCHVGDYLAAAAPGDEDPISNSVALLKDVLANGQPSQQINGTDLGTDTVNGIATKVLGVTSSSFTGKVWIAQQGGFPVKVVQIGSDGKPTTRFEVTQLSFATPLASAVALPAGCPSEVTSVTLQPTPPYTGPCPAHITLTGTITAGGPGSVFYQFGGGPAKIPSGGQGIGFSGTYTPDPGQTISFDSAGTKSVTHVMTFQQESGDQNGGTAVLQAIAADTSGGHGVYWGQNSASSGFVITCTSGDK